MTAAAGPLKVTNPISAVPWVQNSMQTVQWDVAGTNGAPVNAATVDILLSTDGGQTFPHILVAGAANDGSEVVLVPNVLTTQARLKIAHALNATVTFLDISDQDFPISAQINGSVTQGTPTTSNNPTPQPCAATGTNLALYAINAPFTNNSANTFSDLFFRVKTLEYTAPQGGQQPSLCNATTVVNNGGVGSLLAVPNSSLPGGNNQFNLGETLTQAFQVGRPVAAQFRIKVDLFSSSVAAAGAGSAREEYLGSFEYIFDPTTEAFTPMQQLFLPFVSRR